MATTELAFTFDREAFDSVPGEPLGLLHGRHSPVASRTIGASETDLAWNVRWSVSVPPRCWLAAGSIALFGRITFTTESPEVLVPNAQQLGTPYQVGVFFHPSEQPLSNPQTFSIATVGKYAVPQGPVVAGGGGPTLTALTATEWAGRDGGGKRVSGAVPGNDGDAWAYPDTINGTIGAVPLTLEPEFALGALGGSGGGVPPSLTWPLSGGWGVLAWPCPEIAGWHSDETPWRLEVVASYADLTLMVDQAPNGNPKERTVELLIAPDLTLAEWRLEDSRSARPANWARGYTSGLSLPLSPTEQRRL